MAAALLFAASPALADEADGIDCAHAMAQQDMNICADKDYRAADAVLNATYKKAMVGLDDHSKDLLRIAQRNWIKFRDAECTYESAQNEGGSIYPLVYAGCMTALTKERTKQLKAGQT
jgi:uncharacterized protein YecT (DUF1311 family)